jgi:uncharacterized membrane protein YhhN
VQDDRGATRLAGASQQRDIAYASLALFSIALTPLGSFPGLAVARMAPTLLLAWLVLRPTRALFGRTLALGLFFGAWGDYFLSTFDPDLGLFGVLAFLIGHVFYIAGLRRAGWQASRGRRLAVAGLIAFGLAYGAVIVWFNPQQPVGSIAGISLGPVPQLLPVAPALLAYMPLLIGMACVAVLRRGSRLVVAGALVFVVSDSLIPLNQFLLPKAHPGDLCASTALMYLGYATYYLAQFLIARGGLAESME